MKKVMSFLLLLILLIFSVISASAITVIEDNGFSYQVKSDGTLTVADYSGISNVIIPAAYGTQPVVGINMRAFRNNTDISSVSFDFAYNLTSIGMYAFAGCTKLNNIIVPETVKTVSFGAFKECTGLTSVEFYGNRDVVPNEAFSGCGNIVQAKISDTTTEIGAYAFANCMSLQYLELPSTVTIIGNNAFLNDNSLTLGVWYDSYAYRYAMDNNIPYKLLDEFKLADVNMDGIVNINDVTAIQRDLAELEQFNELQELAADANRDGFVDISDATAIQMFLAEYEIPYPIGETITG